MSSFTQFSTSDGDENFTRNINSRQHLAEDSHPIVKSFTFFDLKCDSILEVGSSSGFVLARLQQLTSAKRAVGLEISIDAVHWANSTWKDCSFINGTLEDVPREIASEKFDCVILGFYMFLVHPGLWHTHLKAAIEMLNDNGFLMIYDFYSPHADIVREYQHNTNLVAYKSSFLFSLEKLGQLVKVFQWCWLDNIREDVEVNEYTGVCIYKKTKVDESFISLR